MVLLPPTAFIYTGDAAHRCIPQGALWVRAGRIAWIGRDADRPGAEATGPVHEIDAAGRVAMPGLVNTHAHGGLGLHRGCCDQGDLFQWARTIAPFTSPLSLEDNRWGCWLAVLEMVRSGITTVCDCTRYGATVFSAVASEVGIRSLGGALANSPEYRPQGRPNWPAARDEVQQALAERPDDGLARYYIGAHSPYNCTPELLVATKRAADALGLPFVIHAAESEAEVRTVQERHGKRPIALLHDLGLLDAHSILAHCVWLDDADIDLLARSGAGVSHNPVSNAKLASGIAPVPKMRARGIPVGLGTDSSLSNNALNLFQEMQFGLLLQRVRPDGARHLPATDALAMATREGARVLGWDADIGSLEAGKQADLVLLDLQHPLGLTPERVLSDLVYAAGPQHVRTVIVAGQVVLQDGRFTRIDEAAITAQIQRHGQSLATPAAPSA